MSEHGGVPEWIICVGAPRDQGDALKYLFHTHEPRFICRVVDEAEEEAPVAGFSCAAGDYLLCNFKFIDEPPTGEALTELCRRAIRALG